MDLLYDFLHPKFNDQNNKFIRLCQRNPYYLKKFDIKL